jgi:drug/metabolite transporter (DMT)-like permease
VARSTIAASTAALYLVPPVAVVVAFVWLHEVPNPVELLGGLVGIVGVVIINRRRTTRRSRAKVVSVQGQSAGCEAARS